MKLTVRTKLFGGIGAVLALMAAAVLLGVSGMGSINDKAEVIAQTDLGSARIQGNLWQEARWDRR